MARAPGAAALEDVLAGLRQAPERTAVLLDVDGTLAPIVRHADEAHVPDATRRLLVEVARRFGLVACVSGRRASDARRIVAIGSIHYLGTHGAELLRAGWAEPQLDPEVERSTRRVHEFAVRADTTELARLRVRREDKGPITAFHWRGAPDEEAARAAVEDVAVRAEGEGLRVHRGRKVLEVRPPVPIDKGRGVVALLEGEELDAALYAGDDRTDLDAFRALAGLRDAGALREIVRVAVVSDEGPPELPDEADVSVPGPDGVRELLRALVD